MIYCPTKQILEDFYTNPLQGELYFTHRNEMLGINTDDMPLYVNDYKTYRNSKEGIVKP